MGLITKEVEVVLSGKNIKYYEGLGYEIPRVKTSNRGMCIKRGTKIKVKVENLLKLATQRVEVECDCCAKRHFVGYATYSKCNRDGKYYCRNCAIQLFNTKENNYLYNPNLTDKERQVRRNYPEYIDFIRRVLARDNYICQCCGKQANRDAEVHHLEAYSWCVEKRTDETNGICLCSMCHKAFHNWQRNTYKTKNNGSCTKEQYEEWIGHTVELLKYDKILPTTKRVYCIEEDKIYSSVEEFALSKNIKINQVYRVCNKKQRNCHIPEHYMWYEDYLKCSTEDITDFINWTDTDQTKKVVCLNTREVFNSVKDAITQLGLSNGVENSIYKCCSKQHNRFSAGKHPVTNEKLVWVYYEDYITMTEDDIKNTLNFVYPKKQQRVLVHGKYSKNAKKVICTTTMEVFSCVLFAKKYYNTSKVDACCRGERRSAGKLSDGTPMKWMFLDDYVLKYDIQNIDEFINKHLIEVE